MTLIRRCLFNPPEFNYLSCVLTEIYRVNFKWPVYYYYYQDKTVAKNFNAVDRSVLTCIYEVNF